MHLKRIAVVAASWTLFASFAAAQEPSLLRTPNATAIEFDSGEADLDAEASQSKDEGELPQGTVVQPFGGYPYSRAWHAGYNHPRWGRPIALVVPPNAQYQTIWSRGVGTTQLTPIFPQYAGPAYGVPIEIPGRYGAKPYWPWDTRQFGVYYIRGPWETLDAQNLQR